MASLDDLFANLEMSLDSTVLDEQVFAKQMLKSQGSFYEEIPEEAQAVVIATKPEPQKGQER